MTFNKYLGKREVLLSSGYRGRIAEIYTTLSPIWQKLNYNQRNATVYLELTIVGPEVKFNSSAIAFCIVEAEASVCILVSSITWTKRCLLDRKTDNLGLSGVPST